RRERALDRRAQEEDRLSGDPRGGRWRQPVDAGSLNRTGELPTFHRRRVPRAARATSTKPMPYIHHHQPMGGIADVLSATNAIVTDPCLDRVATLVLRLHAAEQRAQAPARPGQPPPPPKPPTKGIG